MKMEKEKSPLLILTGPTAAGKTALSLTLAKALNGEIISADSMQVYRGMDIGTAKLPLSKREGIPHHLIDVLDPQEPFDVFRFQKLALAAIKEVQGRHHLPILTGGTGFYIQALLKGVEFSSDSGENSVLRRQLWLQAEEEGPMALYLRLKQVDPDSAARIPPQNLKRMIRALEYYLQTGEQISLHNQQQQQKEPIFQALYVVLTMPREMLYTRINQRVDSMMEQGLTNEVKNLCEMGLTGEETSMKGIGYKEILDYLQNRCPLQEAVENIKKNTRHFAKRQLTWFRRETGVLWVDKERFSYDEAAIAAYLLEKWTDYLQKRDA